MALSQAKQDEGLSQPRIGALIRALRRRRHMTLQQLGDSAEVSVGYLSQIERDHATPSLGTLAQIARALEVGVDYFIATPNPQEAHTRAGERRRFSVDGSSIVYERIGAEFAGSTLSSFLMTVPPGYRSETVSHEGEEIIYVLKGELIQWLDGEEMVMRTGDSLHFRGNRPHAWANPTDAPTQLMWTGTLALLRSTAQPKSVAEADTTTGGKPASTSAEHQTQSKEKRS